ncbi:MAG: isoamylase early set domain-containing protein [Candidatus Bipolaricaulota bacterium]
MNVDALENVLREALREEVEVSSESLSGFEQRVVAEIEGRRPRVGVLDTLRLAVAPTHAGRVGQLAVVAVTAAAFLVVGLWVGDRTPTAPAAVGEIATLRAAAAPESLEGSGPGKPEGLVFIVPALQAESVSVVGSFNEWEPTKLTDEDGDGIWTATIPLPPGRYEYAFIIDGRWWGQDPLADEYVRSFGEFSSVRYVVGGGDGV